MNSTMKALMLVAAIVLAPMTAAQADNDVGCGVGTMLMEGKTGLPYKLLASWTNGMTMQSISITFGLINCSNGGTVTASARARHFASTSLDNIARDTAMGGGESLDALAALMGVQDADRAAFAQLAQNHFDALFPSDEVTSDEMLQTLDRLISEDARFAASTPLALAS